MRSHASLSMPSHGPLNSCQRAVLTVTLRSSSQVEDLPVGKLSRNAFWSPSQHDCAGWAGHTLTVWLIPANPGRKRQLWTYLWEPRLLRSARIQEQGRCVKRGYSGPTQNACPLSWLPERSDSSSQQVNWRISINGDPSSALLACVLGPYNLL